MQLLTNKLVIMGSQLPLLIRERKITMKKQNLVSLLLLSLTIVVSFNSCKKEQPTAPEPEPEVKINPNARVIDSTASQQLLSISSDGSTFTFSPQASAILSLRTNDIMVMQRDQGYLRKITSVQQQTNAIAVQTSDASLTDAVEKGTFSLSGTLVPENIQSITNVLEGVTLKKNVSRSNAFVFEINNVVLYERNGYQVRANGSLQIEPSFHFSIRVENSQLQQLAFTHSVEETANLSLNAEIDFLQIAREYRIARITFSSITVFIGPIPVVITPRLDVYAGIDGNASASFSGGVTQQATFTAGIRYEQSAWSTSRSLTNSFTYDYPTLTASLEAKGNVETRLELLVYGVLAPRATAEGYLRIAANPSATPWWNLYGGLGVGAGVSIRILGRTIADYSVPDLIAYERLLASAPSMGVWTQKADFGGAARNQAVGFSIGGKGYIGTGDADDGPPLRDFWEYDTSSNTWTRKADFAGMPRGNAVGFSIGNKGYIGTAWGFSRDFWEYDPNSNEWTQKADFGGTIRCRAVAFSIGSRGYIGLGRDTANNFSNFPRDFWEYNPQSNSWTRKSDFGDTSGREGAVGFSIGDKGYVGTGSDGTSVKKDFWEYDPSSNVWIERAEYGGSPKFQAFGFSINGRGYIGGKTQEFWEYNPQTNSWARKADFNGIDRGAAVAFSIGNKGYVGAGARFRSASFRDFWEYNPGH